jgi:ATP-dependent helicase/nuclease subunit A
MPDDELTPQQQEAIVTLDADMLVSAGAGTGKTRVLTRRFSYIVETGRAAVDEILTLTFTDKAAREMKERIVARFQDTNREVAGGASRTAMAACGPATERRQLETAYISTVHAFCARVLRENALEAGVDPHFTQLEDADAAIIQRQVFDGIVRRCGTAAVGGGAESDSNIIALVSEFGQAGRGRPSPHLTLRDMLLATYAHMRSLGIGPQQMMIAAPPDLEALAGKVRAAVAAALGLRRVTPALQGVLDELRDAQPRIAALLAAREFQWAYWETANDLAAICRGNVGGASDKPLIAAAKQALLDYGAGLLAHHAAAGARAMQALLAAFDRAYRAAKDEQGALDFDDLLAKARDLFGTPDEPTPTALRHRDRFKFFLMDEFQDTNRLQMSVAAPLLRPRSSFIVGDAKQSIYRFLYADVEVFLDRQASIEASGGLLRSLTENFRSHPQLVAFTNALFGELWADRSLPFAPLKAKKQFGERPGPRIEALIVADAKSAPDRREREARVIARRICELTGRSGNAPMMLTEKGAERAAQFKDILMLFRATSDIQIYEDALSDHDVPYYTVRGRGFFATQEVSDLRNLLTVIENPAHDLAMAAVLRSPLAGLSDEALYWLAAPREHVPRDDEGSEPTRAGLIADRLAHLDELGHLAPQDRERAADFAGLLRDLRRLAAASSVAELLDQAISRTEYDLKLLCQRNGRRRYANVAKLREVALAFHQQARFGLRDFLDYLESLETVAERETEAPTEAEEANVVRLMTVHAAKGLEAPVVIIADLMRGRRPTKDMALLSDSGELALRFFNPFAGDSRSATVQPPEYARLLEQAEDANRMEDKRLFYVACTRAKEHLVLAGIELGKTTADEDEDDGDASGNESDRPRPYDRCKTWGAWVVQFLGITAAPDEPGEVIERDGYSVLVRSDAAATETPPARPAGPLLPRVKRLLLARQPLDAAALVSGCDAETADRDAEAVAQRIAAAARASAPHPSVSVTGALAYLRCPRRYWLAEIERLPQERQLEDAAPPPGLDREDESDPRDRGTRLHELLADVALGGDLSKEIERLTRGWPQSDRDDACAVLQRFWPSDLRQQLAAADASGALQRETPFVVKAGAGGMLRGQIDALMRQGDGWTLVDYKSGQHRDGDYQQQLRLYALACRELLGAAPTVGIIYYLDLGESELLKMDEPALDASAAALSDVIRGIGAGEFPPRATGACSICAFAGACKT